MFSTPMLPPTSGIMSIGLRARELLEEFRDGDVVVAQILVTLTEAERNEIIKFCISGLVDDALNGRSEGPW